MKIIYDTGGKYTLDDHLLTLTERAVQRVAQWSKEAEWVPALEIYIPFTRYISSFDKRQGMQPTGQVIIKIKPDSEADDSACENISRRLLGQEPAGKIKVDLGGYGYEGWRSVIEYHDLRELPEIYFTEVFLNTTVEPVSIPDKAMLHLREVEPAHWKILAKKMHSLLYQNLKEPENYETAPDLAKRAERLLCASADFLEERITLEYLKAAIKKIP